MNFSVILGQPARAEGELEVPPPTMTPRRQLPALRHRSMWRVVMLKPPWNEPQPSLVIRPPTPSRRCCRCGPWLVGSARSGALMR
jgi:hypothetical protein